MNKKGRLPINSMDFLELLKIGIIIVIGYLLINALLGIA